MRIEIRRLTLSFSGLTSQGWPVVPAGAVARKDSAGARHAYARAGLEAEALTNEKLVQAGRMATVAISGRGPMLQGRDAAGSDTPTIADRIASYLTTQASDDLRVRLPVMSTGDLVELVRKSVSGADLLRESALQRIVEDWRAARTPSLTPATGATTAPGSLPSGPPPGGPSPIGGRLGDFGRLLGRIPTSVSLGAPRAMDLTAGRTGLQLSHERPGLKLSAGIGWDRVLGAKAAAGDLKFTAAADVLGGEGQKLTFGLQYGPEAPDLASLSRTFQPAGQAAGQALVNLPRFVSYLREGGVDELKSIPDAAEQARRIAGERDRKIPFTVGLTAEVNRGGNGPPGMSLMGNLTLAWDVLRKAKTAGDPGAAAPVSIPRGGGQPLDAKLLEKLEKLFGRQLPDVRIHTGTAAEVAAAGLNAEAFTLGRDIYFGEGKFAPESKQGVGLLGHELTHVLQQEEGRATGVRRAGADTGSLEREAETVARAVQTASSSVHTGSLIIGAYRRTYRLTDGQPLANTEGTTLDTIATRGREVCEQILRAERADLIGTERALPRLRMTFDIDLSSLVPDAAAQSWGRKMADTIVDASRAAEASAPTARTPRLALSPEPQAGAAPTASAKAPATDQPGLPRPGARSVFVPPIDVSDDPELTRRSLRNLIAREGLAGADRWYSMLTTWRPTVVPPVPPGHLSGTGVFRPRSPIDVQNEMRRGGPTKEEEAAALARIKPVVTEVWLGPSGVRAEAVKFLRDFEGAAKTNVRLTLDAHEQQAEAERIRYGITSETIQKIRTRTMRGDVFTFVEHQTHYDMDRDSPAAKDLQAAANVLLIRRRHIDKLQNEQLTKTSLERDPWDPKGRILVRTPEYYTLGKEIEAQKRTYEELRARVCAEYPVLAAFSEFRQGTRALAQIAEKGPSKNTAELIGQKIAEKLANIDKVRRGVDHGSVNVWRLPKILKVTALELVGDDRMKKRLVADKQEDEQPGIWDDIALLALNIAAIVLAAPTGGVSLGVAAGVNVAVAAVHVSEYLMQEALTGTTFEKAQALSQEEPSLFWLAVEVIGAVADVGGAFKAFRTLGPLAKAARNAKAGDEAVEALAALRRAASPHGAEFANRVVGQVEALRGGKPVVLKTGELLKEEAEILAKAGKASKEAAASGIGKAVTGSIGDVNISKAGYIFSCESPCQILRDKYALVLAKDDKLLARVKALESEAEHVAKARRPAEKAKDAKKLKDLDAQAQRIKEDVAKLEPELRAKTPERIAQVKWVESLRKTHKLFDKLDALAVERVLGKAPDVQAMKGQLLEELLGTRMQSKAAREAAAGTKAAAAAAKAKSEIEFIPGHLIRDADNAMFTDGVLAYREGERWRVVAIFESKAGRASAQKLKRAWKDIPRPATLTEKQRWLRMTQEQVEQLRKTDRGLARNIQRWKEVRMEAVEELRETRPALANQSSAFIEKNHAADLDQLMETLPKSESGQARKSIERLVPSHGKASTEIQVGVQNADGSVRWESAAVTGGTQTTKLVGVVPTNVQGRNLKKIAEAEKMAFELMNDLGVTEPELFKAAEALADAAK